MKKIKRLTSSEREQVKNKFGGRCAYSGTILKDDWQVDHVIPITRNWWDGTVEFPDNHNLDNMFPAQKIINHYKHGLSLEEFRTWYLGGLHERLKKLPKKTKNPKAIRRKKYLLEIADLFGITEDKPFSGVFYFERVENPDMFGKGEQGY